MLPEQFARNRFAGLIVLDHTTFLRKAATMSTLVCCSQRHAKKKMPGRGEAHSRARHRFLIGNRLVAMPQSKRQISCRFSSLKKMLNHYRCPTKDSANQHPNPWQ